jgi:hypothetical protein
MYGYGPHEILRMLGDKAPHVWGVDPDGLPVLRCDQLPTLPLPRRIVIGVRHIELDGWVFPYQRINKGFLLWLKERGEIWMERDPVQKEWLDEIIGTFAQRFE